MFRRPRAGFRLSRAKRYSASQSPECSWQAKGAAAFRKRETGTIRPDASKGHQVATTPPILRLTTEVGDSADDPSEDALFEYMGDLGETNTWLVVERLGGDDAGDQMRLMFDAELECFDVEVRRDSTVRTSRGLAFRVAHEVGTGWAFELPEWDSRVAWDPPASAG